MTEDVQRSLCSTLVNNGLFTIERSFIHSLVLIIGFIFTPEPVSTVHNQFF